MALEAATRFLEALETDTALQQEVNAAAAASNERLDAAVTVACGHGHECTVDELKAAMQARAAGRGEELTQAELQAVAGGLVNVADAFKRGKPRA